MYPGISEALSPGKRGAFPRKVPTGPGWERTWHDHDTVGGLLLLLDGSDHNSKHLDYHPKVMQEEKRGGDGSSRG